MKINYFLIDSSAARREEELVVNGRGWMCNIGSFSQRDHSNGGGSWELIPALARASSSSRVRG